MKIIKAAFLCALLAISQLAFAADCAPGKYKNSAGVCVFNDTVAAGMQTAALGTLISGVGLLTSGAVVGIPLVAWGGSVTTHGTAMVALGMYDCGITSQSGSCPQNAPTVSTPADKLVSGQNVLRVQLAPPSASTVAAMRGNNVQAVVGQSTLPGYQQEGYAYASPLTATTDFFTSSANSWQLYASKCSQLSPLVVAPTSADFPSGSAGIFPVSRIPIAGQDGSLVSLDFTCAWYSEDYSSSTTVMLHTVVAVECGPSATPRGGTALSISSGKTIGTFSQDQLNSTGLTPDRLLSCIPNDMPDGYIDNHKFVDYKLTQKGATVSSDGTQIKSSDGKSGMQVYPDGSINKVTAQTMTGVSSTGKTFSQDVAVVQSIDASGNTDGVTVYASQLSSGDVPSANDAYKNDATGQTVSCASGAACAGNVPGDAAVSYLGSSTVPGSGIGSQCGAGQTLVAGQCQCAGGTLPVNGVCGAGTGTGNGNGLCATPPCGIDFGPAGTGPDLGNPSLDSVKDLMNGKGVFDNLLAWRIPAHSATCPAIDLDIPFLRGSVHESHFCDFYGTVAPSISTLFLLVWSVLALFLVLKA